MGRGLTDGWLDFQDVEGRSWCCSVHPAWRECGAKVVCRTLDLRSAYKQLGVAEVDLPFSITGAYHPEFMKMMFWKLFALPFGATASVFAFNQCAHCLELLLCAGAGL
eukprot:2078532-Amphidinium_carterae.1